MTDSVFHKIFLITCTGFRLRQRHQTAVLHLNLWKLPHGRYSPAKHHVSEVHLIGYASYFNKKSNLSSKLVSRSQKLTSEQASWIFLKNYLGILRPGSNCSQVWHQTHEADEAEVNNQSIRLVLRWRNKSQDLIPVAILLLYEGSSLYRLNSLTKTQPRVSSQSGVIIYRKGPEQTESERNGPE